MAEQFIGIVIPVLDYSVKGHQPGDMRVKLQAAADRLAEECEAIEFDQTRALDLAFDVIQSLTGFIRQNALERLPAREATNVLKDRVNRANEIHLSSIMLDTTLGKCEVHRS